MQPVVADSSAIVAALNAAQVEYIVIGGAAAALHGSPLFTVDFDIVHRRTPENVDRLLSVLRRLEAVFRAQLGGRRLEPNESHLSGRGQSLLTTSLGPLDCLGSLHDGRDYDALLAHSEVLETRAGEIRVLDLATLIEIKRSTGREKDRQAIPHLLELMRKA